MSRKKVADSTDATQARSQAARDARFIRLVQQVVGADRDLTKLRDALEHGANPNARDRDTGEPVARFAVEDVDVLRMLLDAGADANAADQSGKSLLMMAAHLDRPGAIQVLLAAGAQLEARDERGRTALHWAAEARGPSVAALDVLLASGADVDARDGRGFSSLMIVEFLRQDISERLIESGSELDELDRHDSEQRLEPAARISDLLRRAGASLEGLEPSPLVEAARRGDESTLRALLRAGHDPNRADSRGRTALISAVDRGDLESVRALLDAGAAIDQRDGKLERTPLMWASSRGNLPIAKLLVERGANLTATGSLGTWTPATYAASYASRFRDRSVLEYLLSKGAPKGKI